MKTVSIIVPVYNIQVYLPECLDSILAQSYPNLDIILVDDGSTDASGKICDDYARKDHRITVIHQKNAGAANAKNTGLDRACGDYVTFIDGDDFVEASWIQTLTAAAMQYDADVVECDFDKVYQDHAEPANRYPEACKSYTAKEYLAQYLENWTCSLFWNKLIARNLIRDIRFRKERRCIDDEFFTYKVLTGAERIVQIPDILYHYRQRATSAVASSNNRKQITDDSLEILIERYQWIRKHFPELRKTYLAHDVEIMFYFAKDFDFTEQTKKKFRRTARFYLKECVLARGCKLTFFYALRLQRLDPLKNGQNDKPDQMIDKITRYFP